MIKTHLSNFRIVLALFILVLGLMSYGLAQDLGSRDLARDEKNKDSQALEMADLKNGMVVGEVGAGDGYFTFMLVDHVGPKGKVYANDIFDKRALEVIRNRAQEKNIKNIITILGTDENPKFPKGQLDMVFICQAMHEFKNPVQMFCNIAPALKPDGKLVILDWEEINPSRTRNSHMYTRKDFHDWVNQSPFSVERIDDKSLPNNKSFMKVVYVLSLKQESK
ncbi:class I SAM-dependent methyltransferase [Acidobacteriota bacterium]